MIQKAANATCLQRDVQGGEIFPIKEKIVNISNFAGHLPDSPTERRHCSVKVACLGHKYITGFVFIP